MPPGHARSTAAEDAAAEAFVRVWSKWNQMQDDDHAGGYVFKTAMRLCRREISHRRRPSPSSGEAGTEWTEQATIRHDVSAALSELSLRQRQCVVLRDWAGFETKDLASMLGMRESTVRVHVTRARERLRQTLGAQEERTQ